MEFHDFPFPVHSSASGFHEPPPEILPTAKQNEVVAHDRSFTSV
jgi:hypothetical protein